MLRMWNPRIVESRGRQSYGEGCLSVPGIDGEVTRALRVKVGYIDEKGQPQEQEYEGHLARIVQHEVDHLNGILFLNHLSVAARTLHRKAIHRLRDETARKLKAGAGGGERR
jgi:peptide deformylase